MNELQLLLIQFFESAIVKVLRNQTRMLTPSEKIKLESLKSSTTSTAEMPHKDINDNSDNLNFAQRLLKRRRISTDLLEYMDLSFIPPTSNIVERLFSTAKLILRDQRASLLPITFEMILFLKVNMDWWNLQTIHTVMQAKSYKIP